MMILRPYEPKFLMPVPVREWNPSQHVPRYVDNDPLWQTRFLVRARTHDGKVTWRGAFKDRDDLDAFLWAVARDTLKYERALWRLPTPEWHPGIGADLVYEFVTQNTFSGSSGNQTYTSPADWNNSNNTVEMIGAGGSGGVSGTGTGHATGGGGGSYVKITNFSFATPGTTTATYCVGITSSGATGSAGVNTAGNNGPDSYWNATSHPGAGTDNSKCAPDSGKAGAAGTGSINGGAGGTDTSSWGQTRYSGGRGGNLTGASGTAASGGGGAAGPLGTGGNGTDSTSTSTAIETAGGSANNGTTSGGAVRTVGSAGTEYGSEGSGSGAGGRCANDTTNSPNGGNRGGGSSGKARSSTSGSPGSTGTGRSGLMVLTYTPIVTFSLSNVNLPMIGM